MALAFGVASPALASSVNYNDLIDDSVFDNYNSMSAAQIDSFLNSFPNSCISTNNGFSAPEPTGVNQNSYSFGGNVSAGQIIYDAAQAYYINPEVLLATIQKEQGLVTGSTSGSFSCHPNTPNPSWPYVSPPPSSPPPYSYTTFSCTDSQGNSTTCTEACPDYGGCLNIAVGYNCPYNCYTASEGFSKQIILGAWILKFARERAEGNVNWDIDHGNWYETNDPDYTYYGPMADSYGQAVQRCSSCTAAVYDGSDTLSDGNSVTISNGATASLYNYTPYESANSNFVNIFEGWFGNTIGPDNYGYLQSESFYADSAHTSVVGALRGTVYMAPGQTIYAEVNETNDGRTTWYNNNTRLGTYNPRDRSSVFANNSWIASNRPASLKQTSTSPYQTATFDFSLTAPSTPGNYNEGFAVVIEGMAWIGGTQINIPIVVTPQIPATSLNNTNSTLAQGGSLHPGDKLVSPEGHSIFAYQNDGNLVLYQDFIPVWQSGTAGTTTTSLILQSDGNLVLYGPNGAIWASGTYGSNASSLQLQSDGNLVLYGSGGGVWSTGTSSVDQTTVVNQFLGSGQILLSGQKVQSVDRKYSLVLQADGNLVLYSPTKAIWASNTSGRPASYLTLQSDGNLVLYASSGAPLWASGTYGQPSVEAIAQQDGNFVLYSSTQATWASNTSTQ